MRAAVADTAVMRRSMVGSVAADFSVLARNR